MQARSKIGEIISAMYTYSTYIHNIMYLYICSWFVDVKFNYTVLFYMYSTHNEFVSMYNFMYYISYNNYKSIA